MNPLNELWPTIAVLLTSYNRKQLTLRLLHSLFNQSELKAHLSVVLVDDGSSDGTAAAVGSVFPQVTVVKGSGTLFWNGGMRLAQQHCRQLCKKPADFYLWLNDDVELDADALSRLLNQTQALMRSEPVGAVVGAVRIPGTHQLSYGGRRKLSRWFPLRFGPVLPVSDTPQSCDFINGNICLLPVAAVEAAGELCSRYTHSMGDYDYGLRLQRLGFQLYQAEGSFGACAPRPVQGSIRDRSLSLTARLGLLGRPNHAPPVEEWQYFVRRHGGFLWPLLYVKAQLRKWFPRLYLCLISEKSEVHTVVVVQQVLRQYRLAFWYGLHEELAQKNIRLLVLFGQPDHIEVQKHDCISSPPAPWFIPTKVHTVGSLIWQFDPVVMRADLVINEHASRHLLPWLLWLFRRPMAWWGHGYDHQSPLQGFRTKWKQWLLSLGNHYFAYTDRVASYLYKQGLTTSRVTVVHNSQDCREVYQQCEHRIAPPSAMTALYCGSLYHDKRLDLLVGAARQAIECGYLKQLLIVGDGPQRDWVMSQVGGGIKYLGPLFGEQKALIFAEADVVLNPGLTGLAILDAFAAGIPYITCNDSAHSPEIAYLRDGCNGFLVDGTPAAICAALSKLQDQQLWRRLSFEARKSSDKYSLSKMRTQFALGIAQALGTRRYQVCIVHHRYKVLGGEDVVVQREHEWLLQQGVDVCLHQTQWGQSIFNPLLFLGRLLKPKAVTDIPKADIYWLHNTQGSYGVQAAEQLSKRGVVWQTLHNFRTLWPGGCFSKTEIVLPTAKAILLAWMKRPYRKNRWLSAFLAWRNWRQRLWHLPVSRFYCPSNYVVEQYKTAGYSERTLFLKPHFCPAAHFVEQIMPAEKSLRCLYVGRADDGKGFFWLLKAWPDLVEIAAVNGVSARLSLVCPEVFNHTLPEMCAPLSATNWDELSRCYQSADLVIVPSLVNETFGNVVIEAAAHGVPVLASNAGALAELAESCLGYNFVAGDLIDFKRQFARVLQDQQYAADHKIQRQRAWQQLYSADAQPISVVTEIHELSTKH